MVRKMNKDDYIELMKIIKVMQSKIDFLLENQGVPYDDYDHYDCYCRDTSGVCEMCGEWKHRGLICVTDYQDYLDGKYCRRCFLEIHQQ